MLVSYVMAWPHFGLPDPVQHFHVDLNPKSTMTSKVDVCLGGLSVRYNLFTPYSNGNLYQLPKGLT